MRKHAAIESQSWMGRVGQELPNASRCAAVIGKASPSAVVSTAGSCRRFRRTPSSWQWRRIQTCTVPAKHTKSQCVSMSTSLSSNLTRWVSYDGYIRHQNDHLSGRMTDISVMGEWQVAGMGGTRPLWNVLGKALKGRFSFEARKYLFSFQSHVHFEEFFVFRALVRFGANHSSAGAFGFDDVQELFLKLRSVTGYLFCELRLQPRVFFEITFLFSKQSQCYFPVGCGDPRAEQSILVMVRQKLEWKLHFRALARSSEEEPAIVVVIGTSRLRWSIVQKRTKKQRSQRVIVRSLNPSSSTKPASFEEPVSKTRYRYRL